MNYGVYSFLCGWPMGVVVVVGVYSFLCGWPMGVVVVVVLGMAVRCWDARWLTIKKGRFRALCTFRNKHPLYATRVLQHSGTECG